MSTLLFHQQPYLKEVATQLTACFDDEGKMLAVLNDALFYPQGGGQKGDRGKLYSNGSELRVLDTIKDPLSNDGRPLLVLEAANPEFEPGKQVRAVLDWQHRYLQMRLHSVVHLHHSLMEQALGHRIPNPATSELLDNASAYNRYESGNVTPELVAKAAGELARVIAIGAPISTRDDPERAGFRWWDCLGFSIPCGGTHLHDIKEIGRVSVEFSQRKGKPKVSFTLID